MAEGRKTTAAKAASPAYVAASAISFSDAEGHLDLAPGDAIPLDRFTEEDIALLLVNGGAKQAA